MYTKILVPLDGSPLAEQVLPYVQILARDLQAQVELLRVISPVPVEMSDPQHGQFTDRAVHYLQVSSPRIPQDLRRFFRSPGNPGRFNRRRG